MDKRKLKLKFSNTYIKKGTGKRVYVYQVTGKPEDVEQYCDMKGEFLVKDENDVPLFYTTRYAGTDGTLVLNVDTDAIYVDNTAMDVAISQAESIGGVVGQAMAQQIAQKILGSGFSAPVAKVAKKDPEKETEDETPANLEE